MTTDRKVKYQIEAQNLTDKAFNEVKRNVGAVNNAFGGLKTAALGLAPALAAVGMVRLGRDALNTADQLSKLSQKVGVSVESLSTLRYAAQLSDVDIDSLGNGLKKLSVNMLDAEAGTGDAKDGFKALDIDVKALTGGLKTSEEVMFEVAERFAGMEDGAGKTALAVKLFGRAGADMIPLLNLGGAGIRKLTDDAEKLGLKLSTESAQQAEIFNDNLTSLTASVKGAAQAMVNPLLPALVDITNQMREGAKEGGFFRGVLEGLRATYASIVGLTARGQLSKVNDEIAQTTKLLADAEERIARGALNQGQVEGLSARLARLYGRQSALTEQLALDQPGYFNEGGPVKKTKAPALARDDKKKKAKDDSEFIARQLQEGADEEIRIMSEIAQYTDDFFRRERDQEKALADARIKNWLEFIDVQTDAEERRARVAAGFSEDGERFIGPLKEANDWAHDLGLSFTSAFEDAVIGGKKFSEVLRGVGQDIARIFLRETVTKKAGKFLSEAFNKTDEGYAKQFTSFSNLFGFAHGGEFTVGGSGGTDSQLVAFKATPGEAVSVRTPAQQDGTGGINIVQHINIDSRSDRASIMHAMEVSKQQTIFEIAAMVARGGAYAAVFRR